MRTAKAAPKTSLTYMPGLDGLRAVAVLAVFLYHVGFTWAAGGFLGVETFFVLSGYLITSLLLKDYRTYGRLRLGNFWLRRARRLWPALWLLLLGTVFLARAWAPDAWPRLREDLPAAFTYTTNLVYILREVPYFERFGRPPLLQHLWSLAVEEQFYLFWPLTLWLLLRLLRVQPPRRGMGRLGGAVALLVALSTLWMAWLYDPLGDTMRLYYGTDTRAAGFLLGGVLAVFWPPGGRPRWDRWADALGWLGLAGLMVAYARLDEFQRLLYQGGFLLTAAATGLTVLAAASPRTVLSRVLGHPLPRWIGTRSYAIYLWHWPLVAVFRPGFECGWPLPLCALALWGGACALAEVSYRTVEHPIRQQGFRAWGRQVWQRGRAWGTALAGSALALGVAWAVIGMNRMNLQASTIPLEAAWAAEIQPTPTAAATATPPGPTPTPTVAAAVPETVTATPQPGTPSPTPWSGPLITVLGDSVLQASVTFHLWDPWGAAVYVDAEPGRRMGDVPALAETLAERGVLGPVVVIHLGTNRPFDPEVLDQALQALVARGVQRVILVNVRRPVRWEDLVNERLAEGAARWPNAEVLDWHTLALAHPEWFVDDRTHLRYYGAESYVRFIIRRALPLVAEVTGVALPTPAP